MAILEIIQLGITPSPKSESTTQKAVEALKAINPSHPFVLGTHTRDQGVLQITSELEDTQDFVNFETTPQLKSVLQNIRSPNDAPPTIFHVALNKPALGSRGQGLASANEVEYAQNFFPASQVTPEFQKKIEEDFNKFDEMYREEARGNVGCAYGWTVEEVEHSDIKGPARCFVVIRGWKDGHSFQKSVQTNAFKKAIQLLYAWKAPYKLVSVCSGQMGHCAKADMK